MPAPIPKPSDATAHATTQLLTADAAALVRSPPPRNCHGQRSRATTGAATMQLVHGQGSRTIMVTATTELAHGQCSRATMVTATMQLAHGQGSRVTMVTTTTWSNIQGRIGVKRIQQRIC